MLIFEEFNDYKDDFEEETDSLSLLDQHKDISRNNISASSYTGRSSLMKPYHIIPSVISQPLSRPSNTSMNGGKKIIKRRMLHKLNLIRDTLEFINVTSARKSQEKHSFNRSECEKLYKSMAMN